MKLFFTLLIVFSCFSGFAQSVEGITHIPDTSFTPYSAYINAKKKYPDIKLVQPVRSASVKEKYGISYCKVNERKLFTDVFYKKAKQRRPAVILVFGGGWRSGDRTQLHPLAQRLAAMGYACFTPDYRLSTEALYPAAVHDLKAAVRWVKQHANKYNTDTSRISILGFSAGGELAAFTGVTNDDPAFEENNCNKKYSSRVHAIIDIDGTLSFVHPESGEGDDSKKTSAATYWFGYAKKDNPALWAAASPLGYAGCHTPPTLFLNSSLDRMHAGREDYISILKKCGIYTEVQKFENSPHAFCLFDPWFEPTLQYIDDFLKKVFVNKKL